MKRTNDAATENAELPEGGQAKRSKAELGESYPDPVETPVDTTAMKEETAFPQAAMPADGSPLLPGEGNSITNDLPPPPQLTQTPPATLAELTIARANKHNAFEAAQHQLASAVLLQSQAEDALNHCKFQQNAAMAELVRQQASSFGMPQPLAAALKPIGTAIPGAAFLGGYNAPLPQATFDVSNFSRDVVAAGVPGGMMDPSAYMGGVVPFPNTPAAAAAEAAMGPAKMNAGVPNYSLFMNAAGSPGSFLAQNTANFMSLSKEEQQNQLLALAKSTQTGVSTSKKHGPYIPGVVTRGDGFYDPGPVRELALPSDRGNLSEYQCLLRKQIVLFSVTMNDIQCSAQGRNKPIVLGQVGVLCRHCSRIPPGMRPCGAAYFPAKLSGLYQASQNMAINHFTKSCRSISEDVRESLVKLKAQKSTVLGGGKHFWANGAKVLGVIEMEDGLLRFKDEQEGAAAATTTTTEAAAATTEAGETVKAL